MSACMHVKEKVVQVGKIPRCGIRAWHHRKMVLGIKKSGLKNKRITKPVSEYELERRWAQ